MIAGKVEITDAQIEFIRDIMSIPFDVVPGSAEVRFIAEATEVFVRSENARTCAFDDSTPFQSDPPEQPSGGDECPGS